MSEERQRFLSDEDFAMLFQFHNQCEDADGYTARKDDMSRMAELGVVRNHGFGRYSVTSFGMWLIETEFMQSPTLPLKTNKQYNDEARAAIAACESNTLTED